MDELIKKTLNILNTNNEWSSRYQGYLNDIWNLTGKMKHVRNFHIPEGLSLYTKISDRNKPIYDLRFKGMSVANVSIDRNKSIWITNTIYSKSNKYGLHDCPSECNEKEPWISAEASKFRSYFKHLSLDTETKSKEHALENALLKEFKKSCSFQKAICNIQPVLLQNGFFQMPTPLAASSHDPKYAGKGGGIDILARIKTVKGKIRLCVMEVKDENKPSESQKDTMSQAVIYATFICKLLNNQPDWWELFSEHDKKIGRIARNLDRNNIEVVTIMPRGDTEEFCDEVISIPETGMSIHCHTLYYDSSLLKNEYKFKFEGTFLNEIKK